MALPDDPVSELRRRVEAGKYRIGWHAVQHMFEEGFNVPQLLEALNGKLETLEEYEEDNRVLLLGRFTIGDETACFLHLACDFSDRESVDLVTAYIPARPQWINARQRGMRR